MGSQVKMWKGFVLLTPSKKNGAEHQGNRGVELVGGVQCTRSIIRNTIHRKRHELGWYQRLVSWSRIELRKCSSSTARFTRLWSWRRRKRKQSFPAPGLSMENFGPSFIMTNWCNSYRAPSGTDRKGFGGARMRLKPGWSRILSFWGECLPLRLFRCIGFSCQRSR